MILRIKKISDHCRGRAIFQILSANIHVLLSGQEKGCCRWWHVLGTTQGPGRRNNETQTRKETGRGCCKGRTTTKKMMTCTNFCKQKQQFKFLFQLRTLERRSSCFFPCSCFLQNQDKNKRKKIFLPPVWCQIFILFGCHSNNSK